MKFTEVYGVGLNGFWVKKGYNDEISLKKQPDELLNFKQAYEISQMVGGEIYSFAPRKLSNEELETLKNAVFGSIEEDGSPF